MTWTVTRWCRQLGAMGRHAIGRPREHGIVVLDVLRQGFRMVEPLGPGPGDPSCVATTARRRLRARKGTQRTQGHQCDQQAYERLDCGTRILGGHNSVNRRGKFYDILTNRVKGTGVAHYSCGTKS